MKTVFVKMAVCEFDDLPESMRRRAIEEEKQRLAPYHHQLLLALTRGLLVEAGLPRDSYEIFRMGTHFFFLGAPGEKIVNEIKIEMTAQLADEKIVENIKAEKFLYLADGSRIKPGDYHE